MQNNRLDRQLLLGGTDRDPPDRRCELPAGLPVRCCGRPNGTRCCRRPPSSKSAPGSSATSGQTRRMAPRQSYEDLGNNIVSGKARSRAAEHPAHPGARLAESISRTGGAAITTSRSAASGSVRRARRPEFAGSYNDVLHVLRNGAPVRSASCSRRRRSPRTGSSHSASTRRTPGRPTSRLSINLGIRYDRYQNFLPEQELPVSRFTPSAIAFSGGRQSEHLERLRSAHRRELRADRPTTARSSRATSASTGGIRARSSVRTSTRTRVSGTSATPGAI